MEKIKIGLSKTKMLLQKKKYFIKAWIMIACIIFVILAVSVTLKLNSKPSNPVPVTKEEVMLYGQKINTFDKYELRDTPKKLAFKLLVEEETSDIDFFNEIVDFKKNNMKLELIEVVYERTTDRYLFYCITDDRALYEVALDWNTKEGNWTKLIENVDQEFLFESNTEYILNYYGNSVIYDRTNDTIGVYQLGHVRHGKPVKLPEDETFSFKNGKVFDSGLEIYFISDNGNLYEYNPFQSKFQKIASEVMAAGEISTWKAYTVYLTKDGKLVYVGTGKEMTYDNILFEVCEEEGQNIIRANLIKDGYILKKKVDFPIKSTFKKSDYITKVDELEKYFEDETDISKFVFK